MTTIAPQYTKPTTDPTDLGNRPGEGPFRPGGKEAAGLPSSDSNLPSALSACAKRQQASVAMLRDLWLGTEIVRARREMYLPRAPGEKPEDYDVRLKRSVFFNVLRHTVEVLVGFVFRRDPELSEDVPSQIISDCENIDLAGTHFAVFARGIMQEAELTGHAAILIEYPSTGGQKLTLADEKPLRPYWVPIKKENILSWRTIVENGRTVLTQIVLRETTMVADGAFGEKEQVRYRVLWRDGQPAQVGWQLLEVTPQRVVQLVDEGLYGNQSEIPIVEVPTSGRVDLFESESPVIDLAHLNVAHYQQWSDYATSIHKTCVPILFTAGFSMTDPKGQAVVVGPNVGLNSMNPAGKAEYVSHSGASLSSCKEALDDLVNEMAVLGVAMLATRKKSPETVEAKRIDRGSFDSSLSVTARALQDAIERAFAFHARYYQLDSGGSCIVNRDFENMTMQSDMLTAYVGAVAQAGLPVRVLLEAMQTGGLIGEDVDLDALEMEIMANQAAIDEQKRLDQQAQMALLQAKGGPQTPVPPAPNATPSAKKTATIPSEDTTASAVAPAK